MTTQATDAPGEQAARLLIVACTHRKSTDPGTIPAIERYDGPTFRLLRRFLRGSECPPTIRVLSAEYGLIAPDQQIAWYDRKLTAARAQELLAATTAVLSDLIRSRAFTNALICAGVNYREALPNLAALNSALTVQVAGNSIGAQLVVLHDWLYQHPPVPPPSHSSRRVLQLKGVIVAMEAGEAYSRARIALAHGQGAAGAFHGWYVNLDGVRVAPKWFVSQITGLPGSAFTTDEARRVLARIGIEVWRV